MSAPTVDRLEVGPVRRTPRRVVRRRLARGALAWVGTSVVLLAATVVTARGWRPPPTEPAVGAQPLVSVAPWDRHLPYADVDRVDATTATGRRAWVVRPRGAEGTIPGIALVAGSGASSRDDLAEEAEALARGGLAVITYDKRSEGYSPFSRDYGRLAADALAALDVVARQPGVDPDRVGLLGFSEGGWVVPLAADLSPRRVPVAGAPAPARVAFTVLLSAPVVSPLDQTVWTTDRALSGAPEVVRSGAATVLTTGRSVVDYLGTDIGPALAAQSPPTYAVWGAEDRSVPVAVALERLRASARGLSQVEVVPGAGHRVPVATGWAERVSDWVRRGYVDDPVVRGVEPATHVGLPTVATPGPFADPRLHLLLAALAALVAVAWPVRLRSARSG